MLRNAPDGADDAKVEFSTEISRVCKRKHPRQSQQQKYTIYALHSKTLGSKGHRRQTQLALITISGAKWVKLFNLDHLHFLPLDPR